MIANLGKMPVGLAGARLIGEADQQVHYLVAWSAPIMADPRVIPATADAPEQQVPEQHTGQTAGGNAVVVNQGLVFPQHLTGLCDQIREGAKLPPGFRLGGITLGMIQRFPI